MDEFEKWWSGPQSQHIDGNASTGKAVMRGAFEAGRRAGMEEAVKICQKTVHRDAGYHGQWEGYGGFKDNMTGPECAAAIDASMKEDKA